jgi:hypothetical protein
MTLLVTQESDEQVDRPDKNWKYPYVAGVVDFGSNLQVKVSKASDTNVGYRISPQILISSPEQTGLGFLDEFCENHDLSPNLRELENTYRLELTRRDDVNHFLQLVRPYLISRSRPVAVLVEEVIPRLEDRQHSNKSGFLDTMHYVDMVRNHTVSRSEPKYTEGYFREEWNMR